MKGFALTDSLIALALISLILALLVARGPSQSLAEAERRIQSTLVDAAQASLVVSQGLNQEGHWVLFEGGVRDRHPSSAFVSVENALRDLPESPYRLTLRIEAMGDRRYQAVAELFHEDRSLYAEEVAWSVNQD